MAYNNSFHIKLKAIFNNFIMSMQIIILFTDGKASEIVESRLENMESPCSSSNSEENENAELPGIYFKTLLPSNKF